MVKKILIFVFIVLIVALFTLPSFIQSHFGKMKFEQLMFVLLGNQDGANFAIVWNFAKLVLLYVIAVYVLYYFFTWVVIKYIKFSKKLDETVEVSIKLPSKAKTVVAFLVISLLAFNLNHKFDVSSYVKRRNNASKIFEEYYIDPDDVAIKFPENKRNLIYIVLESINNGMSSAQVEGDGVEHNLIPKLTELNRESVSFSHNETMGGMQMLYGSTNTVSALVGHTAGIPLIGPLSQNKFGRHGMFLPGVKTIGEVLEENGYKNYFSIGSDKGYAYRDLYFSEHGDYEIFDLNHWYDIGKVPEGYNVFWGIEDSKLFEYSKEKLLDISKNDEPFNFTMLTVDSHFLDGYTDSSCANKFEEPYANALFCSDSLVVEFVNWIKEQDFYENTTVVLASDHTTMNKVFLDKTKVNDRTLFNSFINLDKNIDQSHLVNRKTSVVDLFPTTLSALNVEISGNRLGLGVDIFSGDPTIQEILGQEKYVEQLELKSNYYESKFFKRRKGN